MLSFKLDIESAKKEGSGSRITEPGAYVGTFKQCYLFQSTQKKSNGVRLSFQSDSGEKTEIELYVSDAQGKPFLSMQTINALMMVMKVKEMNPQEGKITKYDYDEKKEVEATAPVLRELMNKPIGLLLNMEGQVSNSGKVFYRPVIVASFDPATGFTAAEIAKKALKPELKEKLERGLKTIEPKGMPAPTGGTSEERVVDPSDADLPWN